MYDKNFVPWGLSALKCLLLWNCLSNFHQISHGAFCRKGVDNFSNGSTPLNKMAAMPIYGKNTKKSSPEKSFSQNVLNTNGWNLQCLIKGGWLGEAKVLCILRHWGIQLILAYSWTRPAVLAAGKGRGGMFLFLQFLHFRSFSSFSPVPLFYLLCYLFYLSSPFLWETTQYDPQGLILNPNTTLSMI